MKTIDLNCDMGESYGIWRLGRDAEIMPFVSSINIACGFHAGDPSVIRRTIESAIEHKVAIGAHPSFPDLQGFGRREMNLCENEIFDIVLYQISAVKGICEALDTKLHHVKPHGALYNQATKSSPIAKAIAKAVFSLDKNLILYGLSGSFLIDEAARMGLKTASEVFADRSYEADGNLTDRRKSNAVINSGGKAVEQTLQMVLDQSVQTITGETICIKADTICIHGDGANARAFAKTINQALKERNISIKSI